MSYVWSSITMDIAFTVNNSATEPQILWRSLGNFIDDLATYVIHFTTLKWPTYSRKPY